MATSVRKTIKYLEDCAFYALKADEAHPEDGEAAFDFWARSIDLDDKTISAARRVGLDDMLAFCLIDVAELYRVLERMGADMKAQAAFRNAKRALEESVNSEPSHESTSEGAAS